MHSSQKKRRHLAQVLRPVVLGWNLHLPELVMVVGTAAGDKNVMPITVTCPGISGAEGVTLIARGGGRPAGVTLIACAIGIGGGGRACASVTVAEAGPSA